MKVTLHVPVEQYGFVASEIEIFEGAGIDFGMIARTYMELSEAFKPKTGLNDKDFNAFIDRQLMGQDGNHIDQYEAMNEKQQYAVQVVKRSLKRLKTKEE